jgi:hypothetical protein
VLPQLTAPIRQIPVAPRTIYRAAQLAMPASSHPQQASANTFHGGLKPINPSPTAKAAAQQWDSHSQTSRMSIRTRSLTSH